MAAEKRVRDNVVQRARLAPRRPSVLVGRKSKLKKQCSEAELMSSLLNAPVEDSSGQSDALQRYRRGEITEAEYLQDRIEAAMAHLKGRVSSERLQLLKDQVMSRLERDPVLTQARARLLRDASRKLAKGHK